jgi:hypothetical protein
MNEKLYNILKDKGVNLPPNLDDFNKMIEEDEKLKNNLSKFITQNNLDISLESKKKAFFRNHHLRKLLRSFKMKMKMEFLEQYQII